jgi:carboxyl-terminal processing protease
MSAGLDQVTAVASRSVDRLAGRLVALSVAVIVALGVAGCSSRRTAPDAHAELATAITLIRAYDLYAGNVDWSKAAARAYEDLGSRTAPSAAYLPIADLLSQLGDMHARLLHPGVPASASLDPAARLPSAQITGRFAISTMPGWRGDPAQGEPYVRAVWQVLASDHPACGWVIDLSDNEGGDLWPMLAGVEPFLTLTQPVGGTVPGHPTEMFGVNAGTVSFGKDRQAYGSPPPRVVEPVAVLTGPSTASSGEWLVLALHSNPAVRTFGEPTSGVPTSPDVFHLPDGAQLELSVSASVDTRGTQHIAPLVPDFVTTTPLADAEQWLTGQC